MLNWKKLFMFNLGVEILPSNFLDLHYNENLLEWNMSLTLEEKEEWESGIIWIIHVHLSINQI